MNPQCRHPREVRERAVRLRGEWAELGEDLLPLELLVSVPQGGVPCASGGG
jgi:hypothetical protein